LICRGTKISDAGLTKLASFKSLTTLTLSGRQLTDKALQALRAAGVLHALSRASAVSGRRPTRLDDVTALDLSETAVTDAGLKELADLTGLTSLHLIRTRVTDAGLKEVASYEGLASLSLVLCPKVSDAGLKELATLKTLTAMDQRHCDNVTDTGIREFQTALSKCKIEK
jgi:hypothetical protein